MNVEPPPSGIEAAYRPASLFSAKRTARERRSVAPEPLPPDTVLRDAAARAVRRETMAALIGSPSVTIDVGTHAIAAAHGVRDVLAREETRTMPLSRIAAHVLNQGGVGIGKLAQLAADDVQVSPRLREVLRELKEHGAPSRSIAEAQADIDAGFGAGAYRIVGRAGTGTVGETYHVTRMSDAGEVVVKLVKRSATPTALQCEERIAHALIDATHRPGTTRAALRHDVGNAYAQWRDELDLAAEARAAQNLARGAKAYGVALPLAVAEGPQGAALVMERAPGMSLERVAAYLEERARDPAAAATRFAADRARHPWLERADEWRGELPGVYRKAINEQILRDCPHGGRATLHADPHGGNVFMHVDPETRTPRLTFIDAGAVVERDGRRIARDLRFSIDMFVGNAEGIARHLVDAAENAPEGVSRRLKIKRIKSELEPRIYRAGVDATNGEYLGRLIAFSLRQTGLRLPADAFAFYKSQSQAISTYRRLNRAAGRPAGAYFNESMPEILKGVARAVVRRPRTMIAETLGSAAYVARHPGDAVSTALQFGMSSRRQGADAPGA